MSTPHDALFKSMYGDPEHARGALQAVLPPKLCTEIDWPSLERCAGSFVDPGAMDQHTDLLFSAGWRGGSKALLYLLFEHQSSVDDQMAFRMLRYMVRIWERWRAEHGEHARLPCIVPIVLYHGEGPWSAARSFDALHDVPDDVRSQASPHLVRFDYIVDDLSSIPDEELRARAMTALAKLVALCFKYSRRHTTFWAALRGWMDLAKEVISTPHGIEALAKVMRYVLEVSDRITEAQVHGLLETAVGEQAKDAIMTTAERMRWRAAETAKRETLLRQLRLRFGGDVTPQAEQRVTNASMEQLDRWLDRVIPAASLRELLAVIV